jgi:cytochrome b involved in lipid metabolism
VNLSNFLKIHPGGIDKLDKLEGLEIEKIFKKYDHSQPAEYLLNEFIENEKNVNDLEVNIYLKIS